MNKKNLIHFIFVLLLFISFPCASFSSDLTVNILRKLCEEIDSFEEVSRVPTLVKESGMEDDSFPSIMVWQWMDWEEKDISVFHVEINTKNFELIAVKKGGLLEKRRSDRVQVSENDSLQFILYEEIPFQRFMLKNPIFLEHVIKTEELKAYLAAIRFGVGMAGRSLYEMMLHKAKNLSGNYTLAALIENIQYYEDPYDEDMIVHFINLPVIRYTPPGLGKSRGGEDFYFYIEEIDSLLTFQKFAKKSSDPFMRERVVKQIDTFIDASRKEKLGDVSKLYKDVSEIVKTNFKAVNFTFIEAEMSEELGKIIKNYLLSNGIHTLDQLKKDKKVILQISNKFFILGTTYYYRNWADISQGLSEIGERLKTKRPIKAKIFACSTGEEVITYALHFLEMGVEDFYLLGTDINPNYIKKANSFRYLEERIERLPDVKKKLIYKYFHRDDEGFLIPKDKEFFKNHIQYFVQDITKPLPKLNKNFSPPYDIVNIQNVLNYIDLAAILKNLEYWLALIDQGGLLVLRDRIYSPYYFKKSSLYRKFIILNESCAVKKFEKDDVDGVINEYKRRIAEKHDFFSYIFLTNILEMRQEWNESYAILEEALVRYRNSYEILNRMGRIAFKAGKDDLAMGYLTEAFEVFPVSVNIPTILQKIAHNKKDKIKERYYKSLEEANRYYVLNQKSGEPEEKIKKYKIAASMKKSDYLVLLSVAFVSLNIAEEYIKEDKKVEAQAYCWTALEFIRKAKEEKQTPSIFLLSAKAYVNLARTFSETGNYERAEFYINKAVEDFNESSKRKHFVVLYDFGKLYLLWGDINFQRGDEIKAREKYERAVQLFENARELLFEKTGYYLYYLLVDLAQTYYNISLIEEDYDASIASSEKAYKCTEEALMIKAVYGIKADSLRKKIRERLPHLELQKE